MNYKSIDEVYQRSGENTVFENMRIINKQLILNSWPKRCFDIFFSGIALLLLSPVLLLGSILSKIQSTGPILYKAKRVGRGGIIFKMYKFRTMVDNADKIGGGLTIHGDSRVTPIGRFLRFSKIDELPNLINVLKGEMSLIGPRPEALDYVKLYTNEQMKVLMVRPGITGPSQVANRNEEVKLKKQKDPEHYYIHELMPQKLELDLQYVSNYRFLSDIRWLMKTFWILFFPPKEMSYTKKVEKPSAKHTI